MATKSDVLDGKPKLRLSFWMEGLISSESLSFMYKEEITFVISSSIVKYIECKYRSEKLKL